MAKRTTPRSQADDSAVKESNDTKAAQPKERRARTRRPAAEAAAGSELPNVPEPGDVADQAQQFEPSTYEPSEEDIRLRAYQRFLERGAGHGAHFDDWLEAERELRNKK